MGNNAYTSKPKACYQLIETTENFEDYGAAVAYGISYREARPEETERPAVDGEILNISTEQDFVKRLVEDLRRHEVSPVHLMDIIHDYLP
ncbi:MAG: DUF6514 family protein [Peptococcaceae bacterium]|nr:DUF6514 family protein [Peptococcaceae bacterium]